MQAFDYPAGQAAECTGSQIIGSIESCSAQFHAGSEQYAERWLQMKEPTTEQFKRRIKYAWVLGVLLAAVLPFHARAQGATAAFQENYAEVNGVRLHYASVGQG